MKKSTKEKIQETLKVVFSRSDELTRNLETYTDLISNDQNFGQVLSFDSSFGIQNKINEFALQSHADFAVFIPKPIQYVQIKNEIFSNVLENAEFKGEVKKWVLESNFLEKFGLQTVKGWIKIGNEPVVFAAKPVVYFGTSMGVIFLAKKSSDEFAVSLSKASGAGIILLSAENKVLASSFEKLADPDGVAKAIGEEMRESYLVENMIVNQQPYTSLIAPIENYEKKPVGKVVLLVSNASIQDAQRRTVYSAAFVALMAAVLSVVIGFFIANAISKPLQQMTKSISQISEKQDLSIRVPVNSGAEIGILTNAFNDLLGQLQIATDKLSASEKRMKQELIMASTVQEMLFPPKKMDFQRLRLASHIESSTETGGDWFGYYEQVSSQNIPILIGDVTGHGMPAALITAITNGFFQGIADSPATAGSFVYKTNEMLEALNKILIESTQKSLLMTFFASIFDPNTLILKYSNAGHLRPFLCKKSEETGAYAVSVLASDPGNRLGEDLDVRYRENEIQLRESDAIVWYTDGILDCTNAAGESYGKRRFMNAIKSNIHLDPHEAVAGIVRDFQKFTQEFAKVDDVTLVVGKIV